MSAANTTRRKTVPPGPTSSNSVFAKAPPNWTDETASNTSSVGGIRSARDMAVQATAARERTYEELERIFEGVDAPFAFVDLDAMWSNARRDARPRAGHADPRGEQVGALPRAARGDPRPRPGFRGLMTFTLPESLWLHEHGFDDLLLAYPTADRAALAELGRLEGEGTPILMVDSVEHLDLIEAAAEPAAAPDPGLHRARPELVAARRPREDRRQALADPHARAGPGAGARDRPAPAVSSSRR